MRELGYRNIAMQSWRGMMATPRNMGWLPTIRSFITSHARYHHAPDAPREDPAAWDLFRWRAMNELVAGIAAFVRERRPACRLSLAAIRDIDHARRRLFQDAPGWLRKGWLDEVYPMIYERELERFSSNVRRWTAACGADRVIVGVGVHLLPAVLELRQRGRDDPPEADQALVWHGHVVQPRAAAMGCARPRPRTRACALRRAW